MQVPQVPDTLAVAPPIEGRAEAASMALDDSSQPAAATAGGECESEAADGGSMAPTLLFGTVNGVIGVVAQLPPKQYQRFLKLQVRRCSSAPLTLHAPRAPRAAVRCP
jgi:hypothetical protein